MAGSGSVAFIFQLVTSVLFILLNVDSIEARRQSGRYRHRGSGGAQLTRGKDPLPWWAITLIFVGGILGIFLCVMALRKVYEKKRRQKMRAMATRRSQNIQRRRSLPNNVTTDENGVPQGCFVAPPTYEQSAKDDAQPPAYSKDVDIGDEHAMAPPPTPHETSVPMDTALSAAPPSYDCAQNDGGEVVEVGGAVADGDEPGRQ
ncbi:uncharacterized protein LOC121430874 [Lytechinus variegatus]|uniref:uncharacterized protein LOC121430874 n=1 Tax=Lytechinus variegatus TaxID=7654 RepID=UPI001BB1C872|nr:uncharacterized protein LOC121430874 [Lytechinus variegatus]